ncbi:hypothetical protein NM688_g76 [Phlebia brevispora]|uniref:Uncharacterized protein n=1 Tax=Phlebia brevispora TaxID=194682 RepID=A0ACC1TFH0_9APHY|nr:hypothetical protein NM688_g76 [Phlebia brevispora]
MSLALNLVNLFLGVLGAAGIVTLAQSIVQWVLPEQRLKALEEILESTSELFETSVEDGLPFDLGWMEAMEHDFAEIQARTQQLRAKVHLANGFWDQLRALFAGLSYEIWCFSGEIVRHRARIAIAVDDARRKLKTRVVSGGRSIYASTTSSSRHLSSTTQQTHDYAYPPSASQISRLHDAPRTAPYSSTSPGSRLSSSSLATASRSPSTVQTPSPAPDVPPATENGASSPHRNASTGQPPAHALGSMMSELNNTVSRLYDTLGQSGVISPRAPSSDTSGPRAQIDLTELAAVGRRLRELPSLYQISIPSTLSNPRPSQNPGEH